jgi:hypothetical protein
MTWKIARLTWAFSEAPVPRMTLAVVTGLLFRHVQVYLEDDIGNRAFSVRGVLPQRIRDPLRGWVTKHRDEVEEAWVEVMIAQGWLQVRARGRSVTVEAYPAGPHAIERTLDCSRCPVWMDDADVTVRGGTLVLGCRNPARAQVRFPLGRLIWTGRDDGSDEGTIPF